LHPRERRTLSGWRQSFADDELEESGIDDSALGIIGALRFRTIEDER
jgi:hypothetical protein